MNILKKEPTEQEMYAIINQMIKDYRWLKKEVWRLQEIIYGYHIPMRNWGVAQYGIEAVMPHGSSGKSDAEKRQIESREERRIRKLKRYEAEIFLLETLSDELKTKMQRTVYDCLLDGMTYREIALHLEISKDKVREIKREIIQQLRENEQMETFLLYGEIDYFN